MLAAHSDLFVAALLAVLACVQASSSLGVPKCTTVTVGDNFPGPNTKKVTIRLRGIPENEFEGRFTIPDKICGDVLGYSNRGLEVTACNHAKNAPVLRVNGLDGGLVARVGAPGVKISLGAIVNCAPLVPYDN